MFIPEAPPWKLKLACSLSTPTLIPMTHDTDETNVHTPTASSSVPPIPGLRIAFLHPDLGLGGAERLVVDAATVLVQAGHHVDVFTAYYDPGRCFQETKTAGFQVITVGSWFPRALLGRMIALCAVIRCILAALCIVWRSWMYSSPTIRAGACPCYDVVIADQVSAVVPILRALTSSKVLFYCHFPDLLLSQGRSSFLKRLYRAPLDALEETTTGAADLILVNSRFTQGVFRSTFKQLAARGLQPKVLHPAVQLPSDEELSNAAQSWESELEPELVQFVRAGKGAVMLSINRFERKKGIGLCIDALAALRAQAQQQPEGAGARGAGDLRLVVAGGYDVRLAENREHLEELKQQVQALGLQEHVRFLPSFSDRQRSLLLACCTAVLYTPQNEHFGIVPLEAMAAGRPVIACNSGGPLESVVQGKTGMLCAPVAGAWAAAMSRLLEPGVAETMGTEARKHVQAGFSREAFGKQLDVHVRRLAAVGGAGGLAAKKYS